MATCTWKANGNYVCKANPQSERVDTEAPGEDRGSSVESQAHTYDGTELHACSPDTQEDVARHLLSQWSSEFQSSNIIEVTQVLAFFGPDEASSNRLYVFHGDGAQWEGFVGISFTTELPSIRAPCINHLYVKPEHRQKGLGRAMLKWAEEELVGMGHSLGALWCYPQLANYYMASGWSRVSMTKAPSGAPVTAGGEQASIVVMGKNLISPND